MYNFNGLTIVDVSDPNKKLIVSTTLQMLVSENKSAILKLPSIYGRKSHCSLEDYQKASLKYYWKIVISKKDNVEDILLCIELIEKYEGKLNLMPFAIGDIKEFNRLIKENEGDGKLESFRKSFASGIINYASRMAWLMENNSYGEDEASGTLKVDSVTQNMYRYVRYFLKQTWYFSDAIRQRRHIFE